MPAEPAVILGSTSRYRRELFERFKLPFRAISPEVDERALERPDWSPAQTAVELARAKAAAVSFRFPEALVIGSDQVAEADGEILHKPGDFATACRQLRQLAGKSHRLLTAVCVRRGTEFFREGLDVAELHMRPLTDDEISRYVAADEPFDCAGSYRLESLGIALFAGISAADHTAIVGLPLLTLAGFLREGGIRLP